MNDKGYDCEIQTKAGKIRSKLVHVGHGEFVRLCSKCYRKYEEKKSVDLKQK